jgi:transposase
MSRKPYPSDVSDDEWTFVAPYLTLMTEDAPQRDHSLREVFNGLRWMVRTGASWRMKPHDLSPWYTIYQQAQRWLKAGVLNTSYTICAKSYAWQRDEKPSPRRRFSILAPCSRRPNQGGVLPMMEPNAANEQDSYSR